MTDKKFCLRCGSHAFGSACAGCGGPLVSQSEAPAMRLNLDRIIEGAPILSAHRLLAGYARACHVKFAVYKNSVSEQTVFQPEFVMPVIAIEALRIWKVIHGASQEDCNRVSETDKTVVRFKKQPDSLFPLCAYSPDIGQDHNSTLRLLALCLAARHVLGMVENTTIDLSSYIEAWDKMDWGFTDRLPEIIMPADFDAQFRQREFMTYRGARTTPKAILQDRDFVKDIVESALKGNLTTFTQEDTAHRETLTAGLILQPN